MTTNFRGKDILEALQNVKLEVDRNYFARQTYEDYLKDPFGAGFKALRSLEDGSIKENHFQQ